MIGMMVSSAFHRIFELDELWRPVKSHVSVTIAGSTADGRLPPQAATDHRAEYSPQMKRRIVSKN